MVTTSVLPQEYRITFCLLMNISFRKATHVSILWHSSVSNLIDKIVRHGDCSEHVQALFGPYKVLDSHTCWYTTNKLITSCILRLTEKKINDSGVTFTNRSYVSDIIRDMEGAVNVQTIRMIITIMLHESFIPCITLHFNLYIWSSFGKFHIVHPGNRGEEAGKKV